MAWEYKYLRFQGWGGKVLEPFIVSDSYEEDGVRQEGEKGAGWQRLQELGRVGWEFVVIEDTFLILKRPLP